MKIKYILVYYAAIIMPKIAFGLDLIEIWKASQTRDPQFIMSKFEKLAGEQRQEQSRSLWLPSIYFIATTGKAKSSSCIKGAKFDAPGMSGPYSNATFETLINGGNVTRKTISLVQPIYNLELLAESRKLKKSSEIANFNAELAQQNLILLVADNYFGVLMANEDLRLTGIEKQAIEKTYKEIKKRLQLGAASKNDLQEAQESIDRIEVKLIIAKNNVQLKNLLLRDLFDDDVKDLKDLKKNLLPSDFHFDSPLHEYVGKMFSNNIQLKIMKITKEIAKQEAIKYSIASSIKLDAVAQLSKDSSRGSNHSSNYRKDYLLGLQILAPIFTGGYRSAKEQEALQLLEKTKIEYDKIALDIEHAIRDTWYALFSAHERINALQNNLQTSKERLSSTIKGHSVGSRSTLEVLKAQGDAIEVERSLFAEKIQFLLNRLYISSMIGDLSHKELILINDYLN